MKRFVFPLASLLNAKRLMEKEAKKNLAIADAHLQRQLDEMAALQRAFAAASEDRRQKALAGIGPLTLLQMDCHFSNLRDAITAQQKRIRQAEQERDRCSEALRLLFGEIKALESLRERQWAAHLEAMEMERVREVDEFVAFHQTRALAQVDAG